jgi:hypothetical protein
MARLEKLIFLLAIFLLFLLPAMDPDLGWHLRCGQLILDKQGFCSQNLFSSLLPDYHWPNHHWLYQVVLFSIWKNFGLWGLSLFNALLATSTFMFFNLAIENYQLEKRWATMIIFFLSWGVFSFGIRSQLLGIFYFCLTVAFLLRKDVFSKKFLPIIFLFWANSHGSVIVGLIFFLLYSLKNLKKNLFCFILSFLATLINPFGIKIYQEAWRHFAVVNLDKLIAEWIPPRPWKQIVILAIGSLLIFLSRKTLWPLLISFSFLALRARRNLPLFLIIFFVLLFRNKVLRNWLQPWLKKKSLRKDLAFFTSLLILFYSLFVRLPKTIKTNSSWQNFCQDSNQTYPCEAINFLKNQPEKGLSSESEENIFNRYEWGGFLIWQLPEYKVFIDGRMPAWPTPSGKSPYTIYLETLQTQPGWQETLNRYDINWILISPGTFMDLKLKPNPENFGWSEAYRDKKSVIYKRKIQ